MLGLLAATEQSAPSRRRTPSGFVYPQGPARGYASNISGGAPPTSGGTLMSSVFASTVVPIFKRIGRVLVLLVLIGTVLVVTHLITGQRSAGTNELSTPQQKRSTHAHDDDKSGEGSIGGIGDVGKARALEDGYRIGETISTGSNALGSNALHATSSLLPQPQRPFLHVVKGRSEVPLPSFSIVMLSYKSPKSLQRTLNSLFASKLVYHPWLTEVIVYFQARRVNEVAAQPRAPRRGDHEELEREGNIDPDEGLVKEVYDSYYNPNTSTGMEDKSGEVKAQRRPKPYVILGDGTNLPVAQATARAVRAAKGDLILYLECDRPVIGGLSPTFTDFNSNTNNDDGKGKNGDDENKNGGKGREVEEGSYYPLASFAYAQIAAAIDHLHFNSGASKNKSGGTDGDDSQAAGAGRPVADVFRLQLYSGPHIAVPPSSTTISLHREGGQQQQQQYTLPKDTYGDNPQRHCLATPWYHPSTSSDMLSVSNHYDHSPLNVDNGTRRRSRTSITLDESLRDICANTKHAKKKMGNVFATAYCKHWRKINHIGRDNSKPTLLPRPLLLGGGGGVVPPHSSDDTAVLLQAQQQQWRRGNPFSIPQQDMCDSFCFLEWALQGGGVRRVGKGGAEDRSEGQASLWSIKKGDAESEEGITVPKIAARGVLMDRHYEYSDALMSAALRSDVADQFSSSKMVMSVLPLRRTPPLDLYEDERRKKNNSSHSIEKEGVPLSSRSSGLPVICLTSEDCNWTNQPTMYKKEWYMANIAAPCEASTDYCIGAPGRASAVRQELFFVKKRSVWADKKHRICLTRGLFVHDEVDNRE